MNTVCPHCSMYGGGHFDWCPTKSKHNLTPEEVFMMILTGRNPS